MSGRNTLIILLLIIVYSASLFRKTKHQCPVDNAGIFITEGAYKLSRNPIYFSMVIFL